VQGPFQIQRASEVSDAPGAYILSRDGRNAHYIGRSDSHLGPRLIQSIREGFGYKFFWIQYATSAQQAFKLECDFYHRFSPPDNDIHPAVPFGAFWRCPVFGCA
jgi:hypothetical protein